MLEFRKDLFADERDDDLNEIGKPTMRQDILGHVTGRSPFFDDHLFDGLTHLKCARSPHHRARIRHVDTTVAARMPGVRKVMTERDIPVNRNTLLSLIDFGKDDEPVLASGMVNYIGEPVVAIVAETERQAREACAAVRIDYEVLPHVLDVEEAIMPDAPVVNETYPNNLFDYHERYDHQKIRFGDVERGFAQADQIVEARYQMSPIEHASTETNGAIAVPETNNRIACYTSTQALFFSLGTTAKVLDMSSARLHFIGGTVGGGFGGKVDTVVEPLAVLGCLLTGRPVRFVYDRADEMQISSPRGAERWFIKDGVMNDGRIVARQLRGYFDGGAYTRLSSYAIIKGAAHLPGPYSIPNVSANVYCVYTNRTPASAMRGFGVTGADFSIECHMDRVAEAIGMDPVELRLINAYRDGDMKAHRREASNCALIECIQVAAEKSGWNLSDKLRQMSSLQGGGGDRAVIPHTVTDQDGALGTERRVHQNRYQASVSQPDSQQPMRPATPVPPVTPVGPSPDSSLKVPVATPEAANALSNHDAMSRPATSSSDKPVEGGARSYAGASAPPSHSDNQATATKPGTRRSAQRFSSLFGSRRR